MIASANLCSSQRSASDSPASAPRSLAQGLNNSGFDHGWQNTTFSGARGAEIETLWRFR